MPTPDDGPHGYDRQDPHDPRRESERQDNLVLLALGEPVTAEFEAHRIDCAQCRHDLDAFRHTVALGRETSAHREYLDARPPASLWSAIAEQVSAPASAEVGPDEVGPDELGPDEVSPSEVRVREAGPGSPDASAATLAARRGSSARPRPLTRRTADRSASPTHRPRHRQRTTMRLVAAALALIVAGVAGGYVAGHSAGAQQTHVASNARLARVPGGPAQVSGAASVRSSNDGRQVSITTTGLPLRNGFYEVWLYDPTRGSAGDMVAIGALGDRGRGTFTLPAGIDIRDYHIVNVSAQDYGGGVRIVHAQSVLQGTLTQ